MRGKILYFARFLEIIFQKINSSKIEQWHFLFHYIPLNDTTL